MRRVRLLLLGVAALALAALVGGCFITSAQVFANYRLPSPITLEGAGAFHREPVDLNTIGEYADHKDKLKGLADVALLANFVNEAGTGGSVQVYITADETNYDIGEIASSATLLWDLGSVGAAHRVDWKESVKLFHAAGRAILVNEVKGDGAFTLYVVAAGGSSTIRITNGVVALVLDAGV